MWSVPPARGLNPVPYGCIKMLDKYGIDIRGKAVILGRSNIVGKPGTDLLYRDATVTIWHSRTDNIAKGNRGADILVAAVGKPEMIRGSD